MDRDEKMKAYLLREKELIPSFDDFAIETVPREENQVADTLSKLASGGHASTVNFMEVIDTPYLEQSVQIFASEEVVTWMTPFFQFLKDGTLPEEKVES